MPEDHEQTARSILARWGRRIAERRKQLGKMSQAELAELIDPPVTQGTIAKIEKAVMWPSDRLKVRIAAALRMTPDQLWNWDETR